MAGPLSLLGIPFPSLSFIIPLSSEDFIGANLLKFKDKNGLVTAP